MSTGSTISEVVSNPNSGSLFFEGVAAKLSGVSFARSTLSGDISTSYNHLPLKNEALHKFNFLVLNELKVVAVFL